MPVLSYPPISGFFPTTDIFFEKNVLLVHLDSLYLNLVYVIYFINIKNYFNITELLKYTLNELNLNLIIKSYKVDHIFILINVPI